MTNAIDTSGTIALSTRAAAAGSSRRTTLHAILLSISLTLLNINEASASSKSIDLLKLYAHIQIVSANEYKCLDTLWTHESNWNPKAENKKSGAFGIAQFMPETWGNYKYPYKPTDAGIQITAGLRYITKRYGSPCEAWAFWQKQAKKGNPWY